MNHFLYGRTRDVFVLALFWFTVALAVSELPEIVRSLIVILGDNTLCHAIPTGLSIWAKSPQPCCKWTANATCRPSWMICAVRIR